MKAKALTVVFSITVCFLFYCCNTASDNNVSSTDSSSISNAYNGYASQADWGKHLTAIGGCGDCHTPKKMTPQGPADDSDLLFAGHPAQIPGPELMPGQLKQGLAATNDLTAWIGPWGNSYAANITPDSTGIFNWKEQQFINCIRKGLFKGIEGSRPLMPPMPVESYRNFTDDELKAIFAYLKTVKPVHNIVQEYQPPAAAAN